ncbi:helix-turn-helix domain-containing protein [Mycobacterium saskatchewanense]
MRRLRREVPKQGAPSASANESVSGRAKNRDPGEVRAYDLLTTAEAAAVIGCSTANVRYLRRHGHLPAHRTGSRWLYPAATVIEYGERRTSKRR